MIPAFLSLRRILNPIRTHAAQAQACMKQPCSIAVKYELTRLLYEDRVGLTQAAVAVATAPTLTVSRRGRR